MIWTREIQLNLNRICSYFAGRQSKRLLLLLLCKHAQFHINHLSLNTKHADSWTMDDSRRMRELGGTLFVYCCCRRFCWFEKKKIGMDDTFCWHRVSCVNFYSHWVFVKRFNSSKCIQVFVTNMPTRFLVLFLHSCLSTHTHNKISDTSHRFWSDNLNGWAFACFLFPFVVG